jgi:hypothetical protein
VRDATKGEDFKLAIKLVIDFAQLAGLSDEALWVWFNGMSSSITRPRMHGWKLWSDYCAARDLNAWTMKDAFNLNALVADFVASLEEFMVSKY